MVMTEIYSALSSCLVSQFQIKLNCVRGVYFTEVYAQEKNWYYKEQFFLEIN